MLLFPARHRFWGRMDHRAGSSAVLYRPVLEKGPPKHSGVPEKCPGTGGISLSSALLTMEAFAAAQSIQGTRNSSFIQRTKKREKEF